MDKEIPFCTPGAISYLNYYHVEIHFYVSFPICIIGFITNAMTVTIFTRKTLTSSRNTSNLIFTSLAVTYLVFFVVYAFGSAYLYPNLSSEVKYSYGFALASLVALHIIYFTESICTWLTIVLAAVRYIAVVYPHRSFDLLKLKNIRRTIAVICVLCFLLQIPLILLIEIYHGTAVLDDNADDGTSSMNGSSVVIRANATLIDGYLLEWKDDITTSNLLMDINFTIYAVIIKFIPSVVLAVLSIRLCFAVKEAKKAHQNLTAPVMKHDYDEPQTDRTENMIIIILLSFLITEIPSGILGMLALFLGMEFYRFCFLNLVTLLDILLLTNAASNFFVYYTMSKKFRDTFKKLFGCDNLLEDVHFTMLSKSGH